MLKKQIDEFVTLAERYGKWSNAQTIRCQSHLSRDYGVSESIREKEAAETVHIHNEVMSACQAAIAAANRLLPLLADAGQDTKTLHAWLWNCRTKPWDGLKEVCVQLQALSLLPISKAADRESPKPTEKMGPAMRMAWESRNWVESKHPDLTVLRSKYDYMKEHGCDAYGSTPMPPFETWCRYVSNARRIVDGARNSARTAREHGGSVVHIDEI